MREKSARSRVEWPIVKIVAMPAVLKLVEGWQGLDPFGFFVLKDSAQVEQHAAFFPAGDNRRIVQAEARSQFVRAEMTSSNRQQERWQSRCWRRASTDQGFPADDLYLQFVRGAEFRTQCVSASATLFRREAHHPEERNCVVILPDVFE